MPMPEMEIERSDRLLAGFDLDEPPTETPEELPGEIQTVRDVVLHVIEEVARHAGHLDIARELLDGATGLSHWSGPTMTWSTPDAASRGRCRVGRPACCRSERGSDRACGGEDEGSARVLLLLA
jgi:hypothetical protein